MRIKTKIVVGASLLALVPVVITSIVLSGISLNTSSAALEHQVASQLTSLRETKKVQVEDYFATINSQVLNTAVAPATREMLTKLTPAIADAAAMQQEDVARMREQLSDYYHRTFAAEYRRQNPGESIDTGPLVRDLPDAAVVMQHAYISNNPYPLGEKAQLVRAGNNDVYDQVHEQLHPYFRDFIERFGYYDLFLVDNHGTVVYSVYKEVDYASNLNLGPYADSGLARAFTAASRSDTGSTHIEDFTPYLPSYNGPASFVATPVFNGNTRLGVLILQMPIDAINAIMTSNRQWRDAGLGDSGETYLLGPDRRARSASRFLLENKADYLAMMRDLGTSPEIIREIDARDTNIGLQQIDTQGSRAALSGESGFAIFNDYRDVPVLSAYTPVNIQGLDWALLSEIDKEEAFQEVSSMQSTIVSWALLVALLTICIALVVAVWFSAHITRPLQRLVHTIKLINEDSDLSRRIAIESKDELGDMGQAFNTMLEKLHHSITQVSRSTGQLAASAEELSSITIESKRAIETQRQETEQVATAMNEMNATVEEVAKSAGTAAEAAADADTAAQKGRDVVQATIDSISQLADDVRSTANIIKKLEGEADNIGAVLDVIKGIAEQTNLLALNAAIEAARAGEQGRGFAVVADEVRSLARRTQESTSEIHEMIDRLQHESREAVQAMQNGQDRAESTVKQAALGGDALAKITLAVTSISDMNIHIASAAEEQSAAAEEINRNISNISQVAESNTESAEQTSQASDELARLASELQSLVSQFKIEK